MKSKLWCGVAVASVIVLGIPMRAGAQLDKLPDSQTQAIMKAAAAKPTPHLPDGRTDLNGFWTFPSLPKSAYNSSDGKTTYIRPNLNPAVEKGGAPSLRANPNVPPYKPELMAKVKELAENQVTDDPAFNCKPLGVPRIGPAQQIIQSSNFIAFLYQTDSGEGDSIGNSVRVIPTDGRPHRTDVDPMYFGDSVGRWDDDVLVVDVTHLIDDTWLGIHGYFHSSALHVVERYIRKGDTLRWESTVEDPNVLTKPWAMTPETVVWANDAVVEQPPCENRAHIVNKIHHGADTREVH